MPEGGSLSQLATKPVTDKACPVQPRPGSASGSNSHPSKMKGCRIKMERETRPGGLIMAGLWINMDGLNTFKHQKIYHGEDYWFCFDRTRRYNAYMDRLHIYKEGKGRRRRAPANICRQTAFGELAALRRRRIIAGRSCIGCHFQAKPIDQAHRTAPPRRPGIDLPRFGN